MILRIRFFVAGGFFEVGAGDTIEIHGRAKIWRTGKGWVPIRTATRAKVWNVHPYRLGTGTRAYIGLRVKIPDGDMVIVEASKVRHVVETDLFDRLDDEAKRHPERHIAGVVLQCPDATGEGRLDVGDDIARGRVEAFTVKVLPGGLARAGVFAEYRPKATRKERRGNRKPALQNVIVGCFLFDEVVRNRAAVLAHVIDYLTR